ncbi:MAG: hypothetical protein WC829_04325 [Hyphomicrobium sp.]|jgi:septal ring factor EnvC (AmiA/AmiB activator)
MSKLNNAALQSAIEQKRASEDGRQILTRSEQKLERQMGEAAELQHALKGLDKDIRSTRANIARLQEVLALMEANHRDLSADLRSTLQSVHSLQMDGVSL